VCPAIKHNPVHSDPPPLKETAVKENTAMESTAIKSTPTKSTVIESAVIESAVIESTTIEITVIDGIKSGAIKGIAHLIQECDQTPAIGSLEQRPIPLEIALPAHSGTKTTCCPKCHSHHRIRISRTWWMRLLKGSKYYQCHGCYQHYFRWQGHSIAF